MTIKAIANGKIIKSEIEHEGTKEHTPLNTISGLQVCLPIHVCVCVCKCDDELVVIFFLRM